MTDTDSLAALRGANPRHDPAFDAAVATAAEHTRGVLAVALPTRPGEPAGPVGGGLRKWFVVLVVAMALAVTVVTVNRSRAHTSAPEHPVSSLASGANRTGGSAGTAPATGSTVPPSTTTAVPTTVASNAVTSNTGTSNTVTSNTVTPNTVAPTTRVPTVPSGPVTTAAKPTPTTAPPTTAPPSSVSAAPPTCFAAGTFTGTPSRQSVTVQAAGGLASITNISIVNGTVSVPSFAPGTRSSVSVVATKTDPTLLTRWSFDATDLAGHTTHCV